MIRERELKTVSGYPVLFILLAALAGAIYWIVDRGAGWRIP